MQYFLIFLAFGALFFVVEFLKKTFQLQGELPRKLTHIFSGVIISFLPYYLTPVEGIILAILFALILLVTKLTGLLSSIHGVNRHTLGEIYFPLAIGLGAALYLPNDVKMFQFGILVLALSDGLAALVGGKWGKHKITILGNTKSLEGSVAFFLSTYILALAFLFPATPAIYLAALAPALFLTLLELVLVFGLDNLFLPIVAPFLLKLILDL